MVAYLGVLELAGDTLAMVVAYLGILFQVMLLLWWLLTLAT